VYVWCRWYYFIIKLKEKSLHMHIYTHGGAAAGGWLEGQIRVTNSERAQEVELLKGMLNIA